MSRVPLLAKARDLERCCLSNLLARRIARIDLAAPIISFSFDDFPQSALHVGGDILQKYGAVGTYYASLGRMDQESPVGRLFSRADLELALAGGHELGCHTYAHNDAWETSPHVFEDSLLQNRRALDQLLPGTQFKTMSYPLSLPHPGVKRRAGKLFLCCRGGCQTFNAGRTDLNSVRSFFLEQSRDRPAFVKEVIDRTREASGWLVFSTHDVSDQPSRFGCTREFFEDIVRYAAQSGSRILPVGEACERVCGVNESGSETD